MTSGNASGINDGAATLVVMSAEKAEELGVKPLVKIISFGSKALDPSIMGYGPVASSKVALERAGMSIGDMEKVNVNSGAIALGHPIGASGARILVTLIHEMIKREAKTGLVTLNVT